jgi:acetylornithine deacetylase/succinyl-diaminopimelate desuccinylase-like protein
LHTRVLIDTYGGAGYALPAVASPPATSLDAVYSFVDAHAEQFVEELRGLVRQPSRTGFLDEIRACAAYVSDLGRAAGWTAEVVEVDELAPMVLLERAGAPGAPTVLLYSHYDVISPEPVDEWTYPPF